MAVVVVVGGGGGRTEDGKSYVNFSYDIFHFIPRCAKSNTVETTLKLSVTGSK